MFRLPKIGGGIAVSDLLALKELPDTIRSNIAAYVGCIADAAKVSQYQEWLHDAGFPGESIMEEMELDSRCCSHLTKTFCSSIRDSMSANTRTTNAASRNLPAVLSVVVQVLLQQRTSRQAWRLEIVI